MMENSWLSEHKYIAGESLTLADLACFMEFGQLNVTYDRSNSKIFKGLEELVCQ